MDQGDFLGRDGKPVTLLHTDDGPGLITVNAARPPGAAGISGAGVVCVLSFQAKAAGEQRHRHHAPPRALTSTQQPGAGPGRAGQHSGQVGEACGMKGIRPIRNVRSRLSAGFRLSS